MANNKYDVVAKLREATTNYYNRLNKINSFTTIKICDEDFYFLEKTNFIFLRFNDIFSQISGTVVDDTFKCFIHGYSIIDFAQAKNDVLILDWLKQIGLLHGNVKKLDLNLAKVLEQKKGMPIHRYLIRMILIQRGVYSIEEYTRDFDDIYLGNYINKLVPIIPYSVLENCCSWAKEQRDTFKLKMELDNQPEDLIKQIFD